MAESDPDDQGREGDRPPDRTAESGEGDSVSTAAVFDVLGHETRLAIIEALAEERRIAWQPTGLTFAELRKRVRVRDAGKFNYHLEKLRGHFVDHREDEYVLTTSGLELAGAVRSGAYTGSGSSFDVELDATCPACSLALHGSSDGELVSIRCPDHGMLYSNTLPPAAMRRRDPDEIIRLADLDSRHELEKANQGTCLHCWGRMSATAPAEIPATVVERFVDDDHDEDCPDEYEPGGDQVLAKYECQDCHTTVWVPVSVVVATHPAVVAFYYDHGIDIRELDYLDLGFVDGTNGEVVSEDPTRIRVDVELDGDRLELVLDETASVVDTTHD